MRRPTTKNVALLGMLACALACAVALPTRAMAQGTENAARVVITDSSGTVQSERNLTGIDNIWDVVDDVDSDQKCFVDLKGDWDTSSYGILKVTKNTKVTLRLHGYSINRHKANASYEGYGSGEVIGVYKNAELTVIGASTEAEKSVTHGGYTITDSNGNQLWFQQDGATSKQISGGLIAGGASNDSNGAGAISVIGDNAKVVLRDVTIAGNLADQWVFSSYGDGGAIGLFGESSTVDLYGTTVKYNHSERYGGGIYVEGKSCRVSLHDGTKVSYNSAATGGGGVAVCAGTGNSIDGVYLEGGSSIDHNWAPDSGGGGGILSNCGLLISLDNSSISYNRAGDGGGINAVWSVCDIELTNGSKIDHNTAADNGGGIATHGANNSVKLEGGSSIDHNEAGSCGGGILQLQLTYTNCYLKIYSDDKTGEIAYNSAKGSTTSGSTIEGGGGIYFKSSSSSHMNTAVGLNIHDNTTNGLGSGIYCANYSSQKPIYYVSDCKIYGNTGAGAAVNVESGCSSLTLLNSSVTGNSATDSSLSSGVDSFATTTKLQGKATIEDNTMPDGSEQNFLIRAGLANWADATTDSHVGFTSPTMNADSSIYGQYLGGGLQNGFHDAFPNDWTHMLTADNPEEMSIEYRTTSSGGHAFCLVRCATQHQVTAYGNGVTKSKIADVGSAITFDSADFAKDGCVLTSWTSSVAIDGKTTLYPDSDGKLSLTVPKTDATIAANYSPILSSISVMATDGTSWDDLVTSDDPGASIGGITFADQTGASHETPSELVDEGSLICSRKVEDVTDEAGKVTQKKLTYTVLVGSSLLDSWGLVTQDTADIAGKLEVRTSLGVVEGSVEGVSIDSYGVISFEVTVTVDAPEPATHTVTVTSANVNGSTAIGSYGQTVEEGADVTITAPSQPGMRFVGWTGVPEGGVADGSELTVSNVMGDLEATASYEPLVSKIALEVADPVVGEAFPSSIESCKLTDISERDVTDAAKAGATVTWARADGAETGDEVEANTTYRVTVATRLSDDDSYRYGFADDLLSNVNGVAAESAAADEDAGTQTVTYVVTTGADTRFDRIVTTFPDATVRLAGEYADVLPESAKYRRKDGTVESADITWETPEVDWSMSSGEFDVKGYITVDGQHYEVSQHFSLAELEAPKASVASGIYDSTQTVELSAATGWDGAADVKIYYCVLDASAEPGASMEFSEYDGTPITVEKDSAIVTYAVIGDGKGTRQTERASFSYLIRRERSVTVESGHAYDGDGNEVTASHEGSEVTIKADDAPEGKVFDKWVVTSGDGVELADASAQTTSFVMPDGDVTVTATYCDEGSEPDVKPDEKGDEKGDDEGDEKGDEKGDDEGDDEGDEEDDNEDDDESPRKDYDKVLPADALPATGDVTPSGLGILALVGVGAVLVALVARVRER